MKKIIGICGLLVVICVTTAMMSDRFLIAGNIENLIRRTSLFGVLGIGAAFVIITGGIDLSIGSVVCLIGVLLPWLLVTKGCSVATALIAVIAVAILIGLTHGLLVTKLRLQPFVVTLCGLLFYRGYARYLTDDQTQGFGTGYADLRQLAQGRIPVPFIEGFAIPAPFIILLVVVVLAMVLLNMTIYGRYLLALGRNEQAARYSGIRTDRMVIAAYVICSLLTGIGGILFALEGNLVQPASHGNFYELYAIAAAVLGGCSLRGGEGSILGVVIGTAVIIILYNSINLLRIPTTLEFAIIGAVILGGVIVDELVKRYAARRRAIRQAEAAA